MNHSLHHPQNTKQFTTERTISNFVSWNWLEKFDAVNRTCEKLMSNLDSQQAQVKLNNICQRYYGRIFNHLQSGEQSSHNLFSLPIVINESNDVLSLHRRWKFEESFLEHELQSIDELYMALGNFHIYAAVTKAQIEERHDPTNGLRLRIKEIGLYVKKQSPVVASGPHRTALLSNIKRVSVQLCIDL